MKNFHPFRMLFLLFILTAFPVSAQQFISEYLSKSSALSTSKKLFNKENYKTIREKNGRKLYALKQKNQEKKIDAELNVYVTYNEQLLSDPFIIIYDEYGYVDYAEYRGENPIVFNVPKGKYDIMVEFLDEDGRSYYVIKEQEDVQSYVSVNVNAEEASNYVSVKLVDENNQPLEPGRPNSEIGLSSEISFDRVFVCLPANMGYGASYMLSNPFHGEVPLWDFYVNNVSKRYAFMQTAISTGHERGDKYFVKFPTLSGISASIPLQNNATNWVFHREKFKSGHITSTDNDYTSFITLNTYRGNIYSSAAITTLHGLPYNEEEGFRGYYDNEVDDISSLLVFPALTDHLYNEEGFLLIGNALIREGNHIIYGSGATPASFSQHSVGSSYYYNEFGMMEMDIVFPFHPKFYFSSEDTPDVLQGDNVPISNTLVMQYAGANYTGRYGELRESDFFATNVEVKQNGSIIFSGNYMNDRFLDYILPSTGNFEVSFINTNTIVDGNEGKNITKLFFDRSKEDSVPPTLQHLQFRDENGKVTDQFTSPSTGQVRLAAGDFQFNEDEGKFNYQEGNTVQFYYSAYNQNNWIEIPLNNIPEFFKMPAFGDYYEASLSSIPTTENNTWYDVRIISTDAAHNRQEQIISPAFKINGTLVTSDVVQTQFLVYPNPFDKELTLKLPNDIKGNIIFKISDLTGKTIYTETKNANNNTIVWNGASLPKGMYVVTLENNGKIITKKIIKK